jgi:hypothetical protein
LQLHYIDIILLRFYVFNCLETARREISTNARAAPRGDRRAALSRRLRAFRGWPKWA